MATVHLVESGHAAHREITRDARMVCVLWVDSMAREGWGEWTGASMQCMSAGILYAETPDSVILALNKSRYQYGDYIQIPKVAIQEIIPLRMDRARKTRAA